MPANVFVSYDHDDQNQVNGFRALVSNPNHPLDFHDRSLQEAVTDRSGRPLRYPPSDSRSQPVRNEIMRKFDSASRLVVLIGDDTYRSDWVKWEVDTFYQMKNSLPGDTWKRLRGMALKGSERATIPAALLNGRSTQPLAWNPTQLDSWLDTNPSG